MKNTGISHGKPRVLTLDRSCTDRNRKAALQGYPPKPGFDRAEYPMAFTREGGVGASVRYLDPADNRGAGAGLGNQLRSCSDGTRFQVDIV